MTEIGGHDGQFAWIRDENQGSWAPDTASGMLPSAIRDEKWDPSPLNVVPGTSPRNIGESICGSRRSIFLNT